MTQCSAVHPMTVACPGVRRDLEYTNQDLGDRLVRQKLYIHIGTPKTGTTSFQYLMADNRRKLLKSGIYYPDTENRLFFSKSQHRYLYVAANAGDASAMDALIEELERHGAPKNVISEENFSWGAAVQAAYLKPLRDRFDVKILLLVRRQDELAESLYVQMVRGGYTHSFDVFISDEGVKGILDYLSLASIYGDAFGAENVLVRRYEGVDYPAEEILLSLIGLPPSLRLQPVEVQNRSMSIDALRFVRGLQKRSLNISYAAFNELFGDALLRSTPGPSAKFLSPDQRRVFLEGFRERNDELKLRYLPDLPPGDLFDPVSGCDQPSDLSEFDQEQQIAIYRQLLSQIDTPHPSTFDAMIEAACRTLYVPDIPPAGEDGANLRSSIDDPS